MDRIKALILLFLREEISAAELQELDEWLNADPRRRALLADIGQAETLAEGFAKLDQLDRARVWGRVQAYADEDRMREAESVTIKHVRRLRRVWVAAAVLILVVAGGYFLSRDGKKIITSPALSQVHDAQPGTNKAILTLSSGQKVVLDSVREDTVLTEGAARVAGSHGSLAYKVDSAQAAVVYNTLSTPRGGQYQLTLPDGTKAWLNAASSITYPTAFLGADRKVEMTGEVYFEVSKNALQPFKVSIPGTEEVEVLGTSFNVNAYVDEPEIKTTLLDGSVRVSEKSHVGVNPNNTKLSVVLKPGEQAQLVVGDNTNNNGGRITIDKSADVDAAIAWKNGLFAFTDADLQTVMRQLGRWYNVDITYEGLIPKREFDGKIGRTLTLDQVLKVLAKTRVHYSIDGSHLTIRP